MHKKRKKLWKEIKKDLTEPALLEMDGLCVEQEVLAIVDKHSLPQQRRIC